MSLRFRLLILLLLATVLTWSVMAFVMYRDAKMEASELLDAQLAQSAKLVLNEAPHRLHKLREDEEDHEQDDRRDHDEDKEHDRSDAGHQYEQALFYQLWNEQGELLYRSSPAVPTTSLVEGKTGFHELMVNGVLWCTLSLWNADHTLQIQIGAPKPRREQLMGAIAKRILTPMLVMLPLMGLLVWFAVGAGLAPLRRLAGEISQRTPAGLSPVSEAVPAEVRPLVDSINRLFRRVAETLQREQRFTADAAHELRTPLAALKTQTQVALGAQTPEVQRHALNQIQEGIDRSTRLLENLLVLARLEPEEHMVNRERVSLVAAVTDVCGELAPGALGKNIDFELKTGEDVAIQGNAELLRVLARNLIDNAIRYSPAGATLVVAVRKHAGQGELLVEDSGPGIPPDQYDRVFDRFYRILGNDAPGSGLGLSIVHKIAALHEGAVQLAPGADGKGLRVTVRIPLAA